MSSSTQRIEERVSRIPDVEPVDLKLEVVVIPVANVDRAKRFYQGLGFRLDADFASGDDWRVVQMTPPGSPCSVMFGKGLTTAVPGSVQGTFLIVADIEAARAGLVAHGAEVSDVFHFENGIRVAGANGRSRGADPEGRSYRSFASFSDPDGNGWLLQEITTRLPGRGLSVDAATLTGLLREAELSHGKYQPTAKAHHWSNWYAAYLMARVQGKNSAEAAEDSARYVENTSRHG